MLSLVELSGSPQAGKDSVINVLHSAHLMNSFKVIDSGARISPITKDNAAELMIWTVGKVITDCCETLASFRQGDRRVPIFNRGLFDRLAWLEASSELFEIKARDTHLMQDVLTSLFAEKFRFHIMVTVTPPNVTLSRSERIRTGVSRRRILNERVLTILNEAYIKCIDRYRDHFGIMTLIDERYGDVSIDMKVEKARFLLDEATKSQS